MSDEANVNATGNEPTATTTPPASSQAGAAPTAEPARAADGRFEPNQWRYPDTYPVAYLRGKTAEEAAKITDMLYQEMLKGQPQGQPQPSRPTGPVPPPYSGYAPPAAAPVAAPPTQDDFLQDPAGATARYYEYQRATQFDPWAAQSAQNQASLAREIVRRDESKTFDRWGPEIDALINQVDPRYRTVETIKKVVGMVKAEHIDELAEERFKAKMAAMPQSMRADGAGATGTSTSVPASIDFDSAGLPQEYARTLSRYNVTPSVLDEFLQTTECRVRGITLNQARTEWLAAAKKGDILTEATTRIGPDLNPARTGEKAVPLG